MKEDLINDTSLLVSTPTGLKRVYCPFKVNLIQSNQTLSFGKLHNVTLLKSTSQGELFYRIGNKYFNHSILNLVLSCGILLHI